MYGIEQCDEIIRLIDDVLADNRRDDGPAAPVEGGLVPATSVFFGIKSSACE